MRHLKKEKLIEVIKETRGIKTAICDMLDMGYRTLQGYLTRWDLIDFLEEQKYRTQDKVRHNLTKWIDEGNEKVTLWYAERQMFEEFGNKQEVVNKNKEPLQIVFESSESGNKNKEMLDDFMNSHEDDE